MQKLLPLAYVNRILPIPAEFAVSHATGIAWLMQAKIRSAASQGSEASGRILNLYERMISHPALQTRRTVLADYTHQRWDEMQLYRSATRQDGSESPWFAPPLAARMQLYSSHAMALAEKAFPSSHEPPRTLIEVSCTGYSAPYTAQKLALARAWGEKTQLLKLGHMGCYAALPALNLASQISRSAPAHASSVSLFNVELSTLHLQPSSNTLDQVVANILFADGAVRCDVSQEGQRESLAVLDYHEILIPDSQELMDWTLGDSSFHMNLSRKVGAKIGEVVRPHVEAFIARSGLSLRDIDRTVIHPGGPKIIDTVQGIFDFSDPMVRHSKAVLAAYGNMSSCTVPYIWAALQADAAVKAGELILSMAFGPGLTLTMNLMRKGL